MDLSYLTSQTINFGNPRVQGFLLLQLYFPLRSSFRLPPVHLPPPLFICILFSDTVSGRIESGVGRCDLQGARGVFERSLSQDYMLDVSIVWNKHVKSGKSSSSEPS